MGASSQPRKNPYVSQGLFPGTVLHVSPDAEPELLTRVEALDEQIMTVLPPERPGQTRVLARGELLRVTYSHRDRTYAFTTEVIGRTADGAKHYLRAPLLIETPEQRATFRLETFIRPLSLYRLIVNLDSLSDSADLEGTIVDLGEGGLCLSTPSRMRVGERLGVHASLGEAGEFMARMKAAEVVAPDQGQRNARVHCQFTDISRPNVDLIARYLMQRQLDLRRRGQL